MELYFAPLACSLATRMALYEAGADAKFHQVDTRAKRTAEGADYFTINPMGQVPVLRTDDGALLTENPAVLQYVADQFPKSGLAPAGGMERYRLQQWLNFVTSELHKLVFNLLFDPSGTEEVKAFGLRQAEKRFARLAKHLEGREFLLDRFTVADCYLVTVLNWTRHVGIDLAKWPPVLDYYKRMTKRPAVAKAIAEEYTLYETEQKKRSAA
ncbi:MAG: glutathione binding-like protein [Candidatus Eiseniibacteriota bacterium]